MADDNVFAPRNALRRTPPRAAVETFPEAAPPSSSMSISPAPIAVAVPRAMTSPLRDEPYTPAPLFSSALAEQTPRASTVEPVTPSYVRPPSSAGTTARRKATTPHAIRGYNSRATPYKNQSKRRTSRFKGEEEDDLRDALRQFSRITAPTTKPFVPTPKPTIDPAAAASRRRTLTRLSRDLAALSSSPSPPPLRPPPRLSNASLKLIGRTLTSAAIIQNDDETSLSPPPELTSPLGDDGDTMDIDSEVARRAAPETDRRMSFLPNPFDRFRDFDDVVMDDSIVQEAGAELLDEMFDEEEVTGQFGGELSFADRTADLPTNDEEGSAFFNPPDLIPDDETDFRLEHEQAALSPVRSTSIQPEEALDDDVEITPEDRYDEPHDLPPINTAEISSPTPGGFHGDFIDSDASDDEPLPPIQDSDAIDLRAASTSNTAAGTKRKRKELPLSAHGIPYPSIPAKTIKAILARTGAPKLSKEAMDAVMQASEAYFENLGGDLGNFARHAKRRTVEEADVVQVMRRHRLLSDRTTVFSLATQHLPRELLQDIRIQVPRRNIPKPKRRRVQVEEE
ncbi:Inner kinetochore subunit cnp20 [Drechslerella dactyloides]|uniref:Inner kinetochore subunit cnp20 n=1 Tax=Drechslerella dactyloides TaxID=74499 RepID=A0AAD6J5Y6_DREDA|nr:Inner kinetochore subunit cnp20 [Drechslerella dactyloides]